MIAALAKLVVAARLATAIVTTWPEVTPERAASASIAIILERGVHEPALLAAIAYGESRFLLDRVNPITGCCGPTQVKASARACRTIAAGDERLGYRLAVRKLDEARAWCARRRTPGILCELAVYASGPRGPRLGLYRQPRAMLARRDRLRAAMGRRPGSSPVIGASL